MQKYYLEIKNRFFLLVFCWFSLILSCYAYKETLLFLFVRATNSRNFLEFDSYFIFTNVTELFTVYLNLIFFLSNQIINFVFFYQILMFFCSGFYKFEYKQAIFFIKTFLFYWSVLMILLYYVLIPFSWSFFLSFNKGYFSDETFFFEAKIIEYFTFFIDMYYVCLFTALFLVTATIALNSSVATLKRIKSFRKLFYFIFLFFSTVVTPPDIASQLFFTSCLVCTYELLILRKTYVISFS